MSAAPKTTNLGLDTFFLGHLDIEGKVAAAFVKLDAAVGAGVTLSASKTYDPPSLTTGQVSASATTVTVTGAALGDFVSLVSFSLDTQGVEFIGRVSAADTVTIMLRNPTAGTIDLASGTLAVRVRKAS